MEGSPPKTLKSLSRVIVFAAVVLTLLGLSAFFVMPKQEDPRIKQRNAVAQYVYPGASPKKIERLIARPLEDELKSVEELKTTEFEIRMNVAVLNLTLKDSISDIPAAWREVERAIERARYKIPNEVQSTPLDFHILDVESVVIAVTGSDDPLQLLDAARKIKDELTSERRVARVRIFGNPGEEIRIEVPQSTISKRSLSAFRLANAIEKNNSGVPSGFLVDESQKRILIQTDSDAETIEDLKSISIETANLKTWRLDELANVTRASSSPPDTIFRWNGKPGVGLGVVAEQGIDIVSFGKQIKEKVRILAPEV